MIDVKASQEKEDKTMQKPNKNKDTSNRILGRRLAKELSSTELHSITGGTTSCSCGGADDCDQQQN
ncbi:hypothetical protein ENSA7_21590 [Enhygromyxa salina]|uniref:Uncharacterized protein n=2 Tax=Enhygromyxa salina TaxID=215803 RepID=A0A2S9YSV7_9BACT|nr:hypothetical protein ENSA7_21590 [Enhygromyxa salina]